jgi:hypothetical protein
VLPAYNAPRDRRGAPSRGRRRDALGSTVSRRSLTRCSTDSTARGKGLLNALIARSRVERSAERRESRSRDDAAAPAVHAAREKSGVLFDLLETFCRRGRVQAAPHRGLSEHPIWRAGLRTRLGDTLGRSTCSARVCSSCASASRAATVRGD